MTTTPRQTVSALETTRRLVPGPGERFTGYGVMGVPFASGHYLSLRDMVATSVGPAYRAVWHRDPARRWSIFTTVDPALSCPRYFGSAAAVVEQVPSIDVTWRDEWTLDVTMGTRLTWRLELGASTATRMMTSMGGATPDWAWDSDAVLAPMGPLAGGVLRSGRIRLHGRTPNGPRFKAAPLQVWRVRGGRAALDGVDLGPLGALAEQTALADFWLPQRGLFFSGRIRFTPAVGPSPERRGAESVRG